MLVPAGNCTIVQACNLFVDYQGEADVGKDLAGTFSLLSAARN